MSKLPSQTQVRESVGFAGNVLVQARLAWRLLRDSRVPTWVKLIPAAAVAYLVSPVDLLPDLLIPGLGQMDDLAVLLLSAKALVDFSPAEVVREHLGQVMGKKQRRQAASGAPGAGGEMDPEGDYIDAPYRVIGAEEGPARDG